MAAAVDSRRSHQDTVAVVGRRVDHQVIAAEDSNHQGKAVAAADQHQATAVAALNRLDTVVEAAVSREGHPGTAAAHQVTAVAAGGLIQSRISPTAWGCQDRPAAVAVVVAAIS